MSSENKKIFEQLEQLKLKPGETLKESFFTSGGQEPLFVITGKIDGTFTLYSVDGQTLKKVQTASSVTPLQGLALTYIS